MSTAIFAILDTETEEFVTFNSRCAWSKEGNAKNAFAHNHQQWVDGVGIVRSKYEDQERYKIVELTEYYFMYKGLCE